MPASCFSEALVPPSLISEWAHDQKAVLCQVSGVHWPQGVIWQLCNLELPDWAQISCSESLVFTCLQNVLLVSSNLIAGQLWATGLKMSSSYCGTRSRRLLGAPLNTPFAEISQMQVCHFLLLRYLSYSNFHCPIKAGSILCLKTVIAVAILLWLLIVVVRSLKLKYFLCKLPLSSFFVIWKDLDKSFTWISLFQESEITSGERGSDVGSELIFLEEEDKFLVHCSDINNFFQFLKQREDSQNIPAVSSLELSLFCSSSFPMMCEGFWQEAGKCF